MILITNIIISETGKKENAVISDREVNLQIPKKNLNRFRKMIELNHPIAEKQKIFITLKYKEKMTIQEIIDRNYTATVRRGQITDKTSAYEFTSKINEENNELDESIYNCGKLFDENELADVALVCFAMAKHYNIDLIKVMGEKMLYNEIRK